MQGDGAQTQGNGGSAEFLLTQLPQSGVEAAATRGCREHPIGELSREENQGARGNPNSELFHCSVHYVTSGAAVQQKEHDGQLQTPSTSDRAGPSASCLRSSETQPD